MVADSEVDPAAAGGESLAKSPAEFEQEPFQVVDQALFEVPFAADVGPADDVDRVRDAGACQ